MARKINHRCRRGRRELLLSLCPLCALWFSEPVAKKINHRGHRDHRDHRELLLSLWFSESIPDDNQKSPQSSRRRSCKIPREIRTGIHGSIRSDRKRFCKAERSIATDVPANNAMEESDWLDSSLQKYCAENAHPPNPHHRKMKRPLPRPSWSRRNLSHPRNKPHPNLPRKRRDPGSV